jgi:hypothetical protein
MNLPDSYPWLRVHLELRGEGPPVVRFFHAGSGEQGAETISLTGTARFFRSISEWRVSQATRGAWWRRLRFRRLREEKPFLELAEIAQRLGREVRDNAPTEEPLWCLSLFASCDEPEFTWAWTEILQAWLAEERPHLGLVEVIAAPARFGRARPPLQAPVIVTGFGGREMEALLQWLDDQMRFFDGGRGIPIETRLMDKDGGRNAEPADILILDSEEVESFLFHGALQGWGERCRLIVIQGDYSSHSILGRYSEVLFQMADACLFLPHGWRKGEEVVWFIQEALHGRPLHEALHFLYWRFHRYGRYSLSGLYADPASNLGFSSIQGRRSAVEQLPLDAKLSALRRVIDRKKRRIDEVYPAEAPAGEAPSAAPSAEAPDGEAPSAETPWGKALWGDESFAYSSASSPEKKLLSDSTSDDEELTSEKLVERWLRSEQRLLEEQFTDAESAQNIRQLMEDPQVVEELEKTLERKVDATLFRYYRDAWISLVSSDSGIEPGAPLLLAVQIGPRGPTSLMVGDVPAIDSLLPPLAEEETHELRFVVSPKDFALKSDAVQTLSVARFGKAGPVYWELVAPTVHKEPPQEADGAEGAVTDTSRGRGWVRVTQPEAELRFSVYYKNQLLQSFRLRAMLGEGAPFIKGTEGLRVVIECDFSQTRRFGALDQLGPRAAAFSLNRDSSATHTLTLTRNEHTPVSISWSEGQMSVYTDSIRDALLKVTNMNELKNSFVFDRSTLGVVENTTKGFQEAINLLANEGALLYVHLFEDSDHARPMLDELRKARGEVLQIARLDKDYSFPWPLVYDFERPREAGNPTLLRVCRGRDAAGNECRCHEEAEPQGWCLRGFWGFRLVIEQLYGDVPPLDNVPGKIARAAVSPWLGVMPGVNDDFVQQWLARLPAGGHIIEPCVKPPPYFLPWVRNAAARPHLVVFIGHHKDRSTGRTPDPHLENAAGISVLRLDDFKKPEDIDSWKSAPRSLVFFLACGSGTERVDTGTSLAAAMVKLGAVGVLGTECRVWTSLISRVARDLTQRLEQREKMGPAMREVLYELAAEGCPLGLAFCYLGSADAVLPALPLSVSVSPSLSSSPS